jgi:hypothetical protein
MANQTLEFLGVVKAPQTGNLNLFNYARLTDVGTLDCENTCPITPPLDPGKSGTIPNVTNIELVAHAFTARPLVSPNSKQTIYVIVQNQFHQPQSGALVTLSLQMPNGQYENHRLDETDLNGLTQKELRVDAYKPNQIVQVIVKVELPQGPNATTATYFRIWW